MDNQTGFNGIAFPFKFNGGGSVSKSVTNEDDFSHLKEEITQILCTHIGEREHEPEFGSRLKEIVFDVNDVTTMALAESYVRDSLKVLEDIIDILDISFESDEDESVIMITIDIYVKKYLKATTVIVPYNANNGGVQND